ncbi:hypothetical protein VSH64_00975 [Amycolatopsis rhabdoformis]|uniref:Secreted protein n=1 Tax=Amycolatopsis rhabdoformis TaxID=1448059 RepID=A0ABZ1IAE8_9PSEU|nr:hypothetical protein [Amycolatopsis rhabdoformis]WSE30716.1 hypothetical protein VSH64_00975 [Amycolatopsis rhabdoformis]
MSEIGAPKRARITAVVAAFAAASLATATFATAPASASTADSASASVLALCKSRTSGFLMKWGPVSKECSYTSPASGWGGKLRITWNVQSGTNQTACVQARMGKARNPDPWQSVSCGTLGTGTIKWPANTASNVEVRVQARNSPVTNVTYSI